MYKTGNEPPLPLILDGLENFEVVYFWGLKFFEILGGGYPLGGAVSPRRDLVLFGP